MSTQHTIVYYDTECLVCDGFVHFIIKRDKEALFRFGDFRAFHLRHETPGVIPDSIVVEDSEGKVYFESDAIVFILSKLPAPWRFLRFIKVIPKFIRNGIYRFVARIRYRVFGKKDYCDMPDDATRDRFI